VHVIPSVNAEHLALLSSRANKKVGQLYLHLLAEDEGLQLHRIVCPDRSTPHQSQRDIPVENEPEAECCTPQVFNVG
jgi:hypothetical protein